MSEFGNIPINLTETAGLGFLAEQNALIAPPSDIGLIIRGKANTPDSSQLNKKEENYTLPPSLKNPADYNLNYQAYKDPRKDTAAVALYGQPVISLIGTSVVSNFNLQYGSKKLSHAINAVVFRVTQTRNVVTTPVQGRDGAIIEYINEGNWKINAKIVISRIDRSFPLGLTQEIAEMLAIKDTIQIHSWFLNDAFKIQDVVVTQKSFEQKLGKENCCFIDIDFLSDTPENLD